MTILTDTKALRVIVKDRRVVGVEADHEGERRTFDAAREVIACGGSINSPALLLVSGIGPVDHLRETGIEPLVDAPEVGQNLRNHPIHILQYACTAPVTAYAYISPLAGAKAVVDYVVHRTGPLAESFASMGGWLCSDPDVGPPDVTVVLAQSLLQRAGGAEPRWWDLLPKAHGFSVLVSLGRPHSTGQIRLASAEPGAAPLIFPNYFDDARDMTALAKAIRSILRAMRQQPIAGYIDWTRESPTAEDLDEIERCIRASTGTASHPSGTCRMGSDDRAVVDPDLRVRGVAGLRVADNSIWPGPLGAFAHAPALMIGEKASDLIIRANAGSA